MTSMSSSMPVALTKSSLSAVRRRLVEILQELNYGRIESLVIKGGEPQFEPAPRKVWEIKFGGENDARPETRHR